MKFNPKIPLYYQIKESIIKEIEAKHYLPGEKILPEIQLAEKYGVSRPTIRQAILELVNEGILTRERGRGTFVAKKVFVDDAQKFTTFFDPLQVSKDFNFSLEVLETRFIEASISTAKDLKIPYQTKIIEIIILISQDGEPTAYRIFHIPTSYFSHSYHQEIDKEEFYRTFQKKLNSEYIHAIQTFKSISASEQKSEILSIKQGDPLTFWQGIIFDRHNVPLSLVKTYYRGDRFQFRIVQGEGDIVPIELKENIG